MPTYESLIEQLQARGLIREHNDELPSDQAALEVQVTRAAKSPGEAEFLLDAIQALRLAETAGRLFLNRRFGEAMLELRAFTKLEQQLLESTNFPEHYDDLRVRGMGMAALQHTYRTYEQSVLKTLAGRIKRAEKSNAKAEAIARRAQQLQANGTLSRNLTSKIVREIDEGRVHYEHEGLTWPIKLGEERVRAILRERGLIPQKKPRSVQT